MNPSTPQATTNVASTTTNQAGLGYLLNTVNAATAPQQFNLPTIIEGMGRQGVKVDTTSPYLGVFNR